MGVKGSNEWKKLNREMKILQAKVKASVLTPKEKKRLAYLEDRFGEATGATRIGLRDDIDDGGPKTLTSDDHWATEISEELIQDAEEFTPQKAWEKDVKVKEAKFAATDSRKGKQTFKQKGLSQFAVDLSDDFQEEGFEQAPEEEEEAAEKQATWGRVNYAKEENFEEAGKTTQGANPFAMDMDPALAGALGEFADSQQSIVPDNALKGFEVEQGEEELEEGFGDFTARVDDSQEVQSLFEEGEKTSKSNEEALSFGEMTTHQAEGDEDSEVDYDLMEAATDYAEEKGMAEDAAEIWAVDEEGQEIEYTSEESMVEPGVPTAFGRPPPDEAPPPAIQDNLAVMVVDTPEDKIDEEQNPTSVVDQAVKSDPLPAGNEEPTKIEDPLSPAPQGADVNPGQDSVPDLSEGSESSYELDLWVEPEDDLPPPPDEPSGLQKGYEPPTPPDDDAGWMPQPSPMATSSSDPLELDLSMEEEDQAPPSADNVPSAVDEMDSFWGLAEETQMAQQDPPASQEPSVSEVPLNFAEDEAEEESQQPLPALDLASAKVSPSTAHQVKASAPAKGNQHGLDRAESLLSNLFGETPQDKDLPQVAESLEPIIVGPAPTKKPAARQKQHIGRGVSRAPASKPNDLTGPRRATVHFKDGVNKRGEISKVDTDDDVVILQAPKGSNRPKEKLNAMALKAIFLMLPKSVAYPEKSGYFCKIVLMDNRKIEGYTPDYDPQRKAFTLFPLEDKGNIERIIVFNEAIKNLWFPEE